MFFLGKVPAQVEPLIERQQLLTQHLMQQFEGPSEVQSFSYLNQLLDSFGKEYMGILRSGLITAVSKGVEVACYEAGDFVGISRVFGLPYAQLKVEDEVEVELIHRDTFVTYINEDPVRQHRWSNYLLTNVALYQEVLAHFHVQVQVQTPKGFQQLQPGDVIIREGDIADTVYQLMSGSADVTVNGVTVGEILDGEIFGAMAVFTGEMRNATVTARENCQLMVIPKNEFVDLIRAQPETAITLLDNMSRRIKSLNEQVLRQQNQIA
ncbi:cyclic nucleotide-binding domain-containing protein [Bermanella marisrubri]|uniref:Cyclic nucleotide-binding domain-containing protein n=1 Tax=Bermanella marisrubri TaxID=207949 RepID=Q1N134_9GAMM|nr:cyclic nucleotide-binding domain-containing protein [Bermanella marisrubri]EAT11840.1 hypothetical protein RED65_13802 [Oceanobacter sp. RED65] [Bermanella marisrubri]QIZ83077.1 cyclic nucleotide-binding domain-containing protein [Bermanella marisrubri]